MGKCPNCGNKGWTLRTETCIICGKVGCKKCTMPLFWLRLTGYLAVVCSEKCWKRFLEEIKPYFQRVLEDEQVSGLGFHGEFVQKYLKKAYSSYILEKPERFPKRNENYVRKWLDKEDDHCHYFEWIYDRDVYEDTAPPYEEHFLYPVVYIEEDGERETLEHDKEHYKGRSDPHQSSYRLFQEIFNWLMEYGNEQYFIKQLERVRHLEKVGRYEDASKILEEVAIHYEGFKKYDKAREMRDKAIQLKAKERGILVKKTVVDLNKLIQQIKDGGIVVVYRCPNCGGKLKVGKDTRVESLKVCEHCGSEIETMELADFLRTALS